MDFDGAQAVWINSRPQKNEYAAFKQEFLFDGKTAVLYIAAESDYIAVINGELVSFNQFAGYRNEKYFDSIDISEHCRTGRNLLEVTVRYEGVDSAVRIDDGAWLIYCIRQDAEKTLCKSGEKTLGGEHPGYVGYTTRIITPQLGLACDMKNGGTTVYSSCVPVNVKCHFAPRLVERCRFADTATEGMALGNGIYDFGREVSGYIHLKLNCREQGTVKLAYGEHLADGRVRRVIGNRDFSLNFECCSGENEFLQLFVRLGTRYVQLLSDSEVEVLSLQLLEYEYPITEKRVDLDGEDKIIYDTCVRTLKLCMHNHYEDCPWREQALYVLDSRNQMLCGYFAFEQHDFARANIVFMSKGYRADGLLELTFPAVNTPSIPFFSVMYPVLVWEYVHYTGDRTVVDEVMDTMLHIMTVMKNRIDECGLIQNLPKPYWNFYEWSDGSDGMGDGVYDNYDLILNCAYLYSIEKFRDLCSIGNVFFEADTVSLRKKIADIFYDNEKRLFRANDSERKLYSRLGNAFAVLADIEGASDCNLTDAEIVPETLSMSCFVYDALIKQNRENMEFVRKDIREKYGYMLSRGATSFWETMNGEADFDGAGSLCHGWSAMPVYYLLTAKRF